MHVFAGALWCVLIPDVRHAPECKRSQSETSTDYAQSALCRFAFLPQNFASFGLHCQMVRLTFNYSERRAGMCDVEPQSGVAIVKAIAAIAHQCKVTCQSAWLLTNHRPR